MEAINYIKRYNKKFIGDVNNSIVDKDNHNYHYYELMNEIDKTKDILIIMDNKKLLITDYKNKNKKILNLGEKVQLKKGNYKKLILYFSYENNNYNINFSVNYRINKRIFIFVLSNNNIENLKCNIEINLECSINIDCDKKQFFIFIENIKTLKKIDSYSINTINYAENVEIIKINNLFYSPNVKQLYYITGYNNKPIKISEIIEKYPKLEILRLDNFKTKIIFDCPINFKKIKFNMNDENIIIENNNFNCDEIFLIVDDINKINKYINMFSSEKLTLKILITSFNINEIKNFKENNISFKFNKLIAFDCIKSHMTKEFLQSIFKTNKIIIKEFSFFKYFRN